jgi:hypothetical protein
MVGVGGRSSEDEPTALDGICADAVGGRVWTPSGCRTDEALGWKCCLRYAGGDESSGGEDIVGVGGKSSTTGTPPRAAIEVPP